MLETILGWFVKTNSDLYQHSYPQPITIDNVFYTIPALQEMKKNRISQEEVRKLLKQNPVELEILHENIALILENYKNKERKLISVLRFVK